MLLLPPLLLVTPSFLSLPIAKDWRLLEINSIDKEVIVFMLVFILESCFGAGNDPAHLKTVIQ